MDDYPEGEVASAGQHGRGSGSTVLYKVEARSTYHAPQTVCGNVLDNRWRELQFEQSPIGVPSGPMFGPRHTTGFEYEAAEALRWWFHAQAGFAACLETRLVKYRMSWTYETEELGVSEKADCRTTVAGHFTPRFSSTTEPDPKPDAQGGAS